MDIVKITGGVRLEGSVTVSGSKNACLPIFAACLLTTEPCIIENVPDLSDVHFMVQIIKKLGVDVQQIAPNTWQITSGDTLDHQAAYELVRKMRASICVLGPLVGRLRKASVSLPGGCSIGQRPIDLHLKGLTALGCTITIKDGYIHVDATNIKGSNVFLGGRYGSTVTGTANIIMAAVLAPGTTEIESAACEPEIVDLCNFLVKMGAKIENIGSHCLIIHGVQALKGAKHRVIGDRLEAGTLLIAGLITNGVVTVHGVDPKHLGAYLNILQESNADLIIHQDGSITANGTTSQLKPVEVVTLPYPGYPTDLQAQMCALMSITPGLSIITERVYPSRYMHVSELQRMGATISIEGASAIINGRKSLSGSAVMASDLRAGAALYLAGLVAIGETWIQRIYHVDRGYDKLEDKLRKLGAIIERLPGSQLPEIYKDVT